MYKKATQQNEQRDSEIVYSPSDLMTYMVSPYASWMDHYYLLRPDDVSPDEQSSDQAMVAERGMAHEQKVLHELREHYTDLVEVPSGDRVRAAERTQQALSSGVSAVYQGYLQHEEFAGWCDFIIRASDGRYQIWDTKLARKPKPYFAIQLCSYAEMLVHMIGPDRVSDRVGIILGSGDWREYRRADYADYYQSLKARFRAMHASFLPDRTTCPEPLFNAEHRRWNSHAKQYFTERDHIVQVAGITSGAIKKLNAAGIETMSQLANVYGNANADVPKLKVETLHKLAHQASLQVRTRELRLQDPDAKPVFEVLPTDPTRTMPTGFERLPRKDAADVYFDLEGFPLVEGGLEYLWGVCYHDANTDELQFRDWWAHNAAQEKEAFVSFVDWVYNRWREFPGMHIYHYAAYELSVIRRLSTRYATRQDEVDMLLRNEVFVDLYAVVSQALRLGEDSYSIKRVEKLYRDKSKRDTDVATAGESIVQYARWLEEEVDPHAATYPTWHTSTILRGIRDYNEDDCRSTHELTVWLRNLAAQHGATVDDEDSDIRKDASETSEPEETDPERRRIETALRALPDPISQTLADLVDFHRREAKPMWWTYFDRQKMSEEELWDDRGCIAGVSAVGAPTKMGRSMVQEYSFNAEQECKLATSGKAMVQFAQLPGITFEVPEVDLYSGRLFLKATQLTLDRLPDGAFPTYGSLLPYEYVNASVIRGALTHLCSDWLDHGTIPPATRAILERTSPAALPQRANEDTLQAAIRIARTMSGDCLVIQGPPGTGKTYTAARVIADLLKRGKTVGITSNGHKAIMNLLQECGSITSLKGCKVGGADADDPLFTKHPDLKFIKSTTTSKQSYNGGVIAGTAWLFTRKEWIDSLDYLFIDEAGQVSLANAIAVSRCAKNIVLMGDQMQLEQPIQGAHPGDAKLSVLQYHLRDEELSTPTNTVCHAVIAQEKGLFLAESRRMHPRICAVVSELAYEDRLSSHPECEHQRLLVPQYHELPTAGVMFSGIEHDGNVQRSDEEVDHIARLVSMLCSVEYHDRSGQVRDLCVSDILCIAPYNAQVRALQHRLGPDARVGSVDKFQGQEAPVCIFSLCSSYGEYGSRGLRFILDPNRLNVALSRAQCLAIVVGDPRIASTSVQNLADLQLVNALCKVVHASSTSRI